MAGTVIVAADVNTINTTIKDAFNALVTGSNELAGGLTMGGALTISGLATHGGNVVSDTDSTDDLGTTTVRWANLYVDDITVTTGVSASTLTGTLQTAAQANVTSLGTLTALTVSGTITMTAGVSKIVPGATSWGVRNTADGADNVIITDAGAVTFRSTVGGISTCTATTFSGALSGNASTATILATARTIGGVSFDGSANIVPTTIAVTDTTDTTCFVGLWESATGDLLPQSDGALLYNAGTGELTATTYIGTIATTTQNSITTMTGLVTTGALASGTIATGFGNINNAANTLTTGALTATTGAFSGAVTIDDMDEWLLLTDTATSGSVDLTFQNGTTGTGSAGFQIGITTTEKAILLNFENTDMLFHVNNTLAATLAPGGNLTIVGDLVVSGTGPHAIGGAVDSSTHLLVAGTFAPASHSSVLRLNTTTTGAVGADMIGLYLTPTFTEAASGTHGNLFGMRINAPTVTAGNAAVTDTATVFIGGAMSAGSGNNYALWVDAGDVRIDDDLVMAAGASIWLDGDGDTRIVEGSSDNVTFFVGGVGLLNLVESTLDSVTVVGALLNTAASTTAQSGFRLPHGTAPTSPVNGDMWTTTAGLFLRTNGSTVGPFTA